MLTNLLHFMAFFFNPRNLKASENILVSSCTFPSFPPPQIPRWCRRLWGPLALESMPPAGHACPAWRIFGSQPSFLPTMRRQLGPPQSSVPRGRGGEGGSEASWACGEGAALDGMGEVLYGILMAVFKWGRLFSDGEELLGTLKV